MSVPSKVAFWLFAAFTRQVIFLIIYQLISKKSHCDVIAYASLVLVETRKKIKRRWITVIKIITNLSASISSNGINNRNKMLLNEAQAVWEVNKLYMSYDGDEEEVVSKIAELRAQDNTRAVSLL